MIDLVNSFQRHFKCTRSYCKKINKISKTVKCRFDYPKLIIIDNVLSIYLDEDNNIIDMSFEPKRNDQ